MRGQLAEVGKAKPLPAGLAERQLRSTDSEGLGRLMAAAYRETVDDHGENEQWHQAEATRTLRGHFGAVIWEASRVAVDGDELAGTCLVTDDDPHLLLAFALVAPLWQRQGVGTTLIAHSAQALLAAGHREWTLTVTDGNPARRLYERLGFTADESLRTSTAPRRPGVEPLVPE
jgi:GNAT superfamily N-acetyltransferase